MSIMSTGTAQQRRGKGVSKPDMPSTILVVEDHSTNSNTSHNSMNDTTTTAANDNHSSDPSGLDDERVSLISHQQQLVAKSLSIATTNLNNSTTATLLRPIDYASVLASNNTNANGTTTNNNDATTTPNTTTGSTAKRIVKVATVRRNLLGTGPFDTYWLNLDCCGLFCALLTYLLHLYGVYTVCCILIPPWMSTITTTTVPSSDTGSDTTTNHYERTLSLAGIFHRIVFTTLTIFAVIAHFKAMTTDPGAVPPDAKPIVTDETPTTTETVENGTEPNSTPKTRRICRRCRTYKPPRAHHCSICGRCIIKMDHHCPWVNNCVGIGNHKYFLLFVFYTFITCIYSLCLVVVRFSTCVHGFHHHHRRYHYKAGQIINPAADAASEMAALVASGQGNQHCLDRPAQLLNVLGLLIEALLFGMFTSCMMFDQADVIKSKVTHIDRLKGEEISGKHIPGVTEVFGVGPIFNSSSAKSRRKQSSLFSRNTTNNKSKKRYDDYRTDTDASDNNTIPSLTSTTDGLSSSNNNNNNNNIPPPQLSSKFRWDWLSPFGRVVFPPAVQDEIMGFCRPCLPRRPSASFDDSTVELGTFKNNTNTNNNRMIINSPSRVHTTTKGTAIRNVEQIL